MKRFPTGGGSSPCPSSPCPSVSSPVVRRPSVRRPCRRGGVVAWWFPRCPVRRSVVRRPSVVVRPCRPLRGGRPSRQAGGGSSSCSSYCPVVPVVPPSGGVVRRVKRKGARGLVKVLFRRGRPSGRSGSVVAVAVAGRGRSCSPFRGRSGRVRPVAVSVLSVRVPPSSGSPIGGGCPSVSRGSGSRSGGVSVGVGRAGVSAVRGRGSSRSVACPSVGVAGGGRACRLSARVAVARLSPSPLAGGRRRVSVAVSPPTGGRSPVSPYTASIHL